MMIILPLMNVIFALTIIDAAFINAEDATYLWTVWSLFALTYLLMLMVAATLDAAQADNRKIISANACAMMINAMIGMAFIYCHAVMPDFNLPLVGRLHLWVLLIICLLGWMQVSKTLWRNRRETNS